MKKLKLKDMAKQVIDNPNMTFAPDSDADQASLSAPTKVKITALLDEDVLHWLKDLAPTKGMKYQTLLNSLLKQQMLEGQHSGEMSTREVLKAILKRMEVLEKTVTTGKSAKGA